MKHNSSLCAFLRHSNRLHIHQGFLSLTVALLMAANGWAATVTKDYGPFSVTFCNKGDAFTTDGSSTTYTGVSDWTATQMADVQASIATWDAKIDNTPGRKIRLTAIWYDWGDGSSILGGSDSVKWGNTQHVWNAGEGVWRDGWTGGASGEDSTTYDTYILYDNDAAGFGWNFGAESPAASKIDFRSVVTHELGHSLGFDSTFGLVTDNIFGATGYGVSAWDSFLVDQNGYTAEGGTTGGGGDFDQTGTVYFTGANAKAANGDNDVAIYAPDTYSSGSSLAHLDYATFPNALMNPFVATGVTHREPTNLEWAMMKDMGWTIIPEPGVLVLLATGLLGFLVYGWRKRK